MDLKIGDRRGIAPNGEPEAAGLRAIAHGFASAFGDDDHQKLTLESPMYDALYVWCQSRLKA